MGIKWKDFQLPKFLEIDESTHTPTYAKFIAEPFERGFGVTLGNSLRRVLLSSIEGSAVTSVKFDSVLHEFSTIDGVQEDVTDIILNLKNLILEFSLPCRQDHLYQKRQGGRGDRPRYHYGRDC